MSPPGLLTSGVCAALNKAEARYLLMGDAACALHGHVRATRDVDLLIERTIDNARRVLQALAEAGYPAAAAWAPDQLVHKPVTQKLMQAKFQRIPASKFKTSGKAVRTPATRRRIGSALPGTGLRQDCRNALAGIATLGG